MDFNRIMQTVNILFPHLEKKVAECRSGTLQQHYTYAGSGTGEHQPTSNTGV